MLHEQMKPWMSTDGVVITPELVKPSDDGSEIFYRYGINDTHKLWFVQMQDNGCIYSVSVAPKNGVKDDFEYYVLDEKLDFFYPNRFVLRGPSRNMTAEEADKFIEQMKKAKLLISAVQHFFESGPHAVKYWAERAREKINHTNLGDYDLGGVEITDDDCVNIACRVIDGTELSEAVTQYLCEVREVLDAGLDDIEEEL